MKRKYDIEEVGEVGTSAIFVELVESIEAAFSANMLVTSRIMASLPQIRENSCALTRKIAEFFGSARSSSA